MRAIRIKNFRSILDSGDIKLNNINLVLGKNSSGKSSFLRLFPMFKQTVRNELRGPVLWFDDSYDFGNFSNAISRYATSDKNIMFGFTVDLPNKKCASEKCSDCFIYQYSDNLFCKNAKQASLDLYLSSDNNGTFLQKIKVKVGEYNISLKIKNRNDNIDISINNIHYDHILLKWRYNTKGILPDFVGTSDNPSKTVSQIINEYIGNNKEQFKYTEKDFRSLFFIKSSNSKDIYAQFKRKRNNNFAKLITESLDCKRISVQAFSQMSQSCIFTVDVFKERYDFASDSFAHLFGYNPTWIKTIRQQGDLLEERIHPDDRMQLTECQIEHGQFIYSLPPEERNDYRQIFQFRMLNARQQYINVSSRQQVIETDRNGKAWIIMGVMDILPDQTPIERIKRTVVNRKTGEMLPTCTVSPDKQLSNREKEILRLIRQGFLSKEIAHQLGVSIYTVNNHRKNILSKLDANNIMEAIHIVENLGIYL